MSKMKNKRTKEVAHQENYQKTKYYSIRGGGGGAAQGAKLKQ
jgi:hypothetical protein